MKIKTILSAFAALIIFCNLNAQKKGPLELPAKKTTLSIKIDGIVDDEAWKTAPVMTNLIEFRPNPGGVENPETKTIAWLLYDDQGIYFGGYCFERTKDSIATELVGRDGFGTNDYVGLIFDTYYDKLNGFEYFLTPLGEQWDAKMTTDGEDFSWNAVWHSGAVIHDDGWSFEMFLPYSAIRFGKNDVQNWGLNITRRRRKTEQQYTWSPIDPNVNGFLTQEGVWTGITGIKPPLRLQFSPYLSTYVNHYPESDPSKKNWTSSINGGMDVKYGINQAFTLDATLIPDFGQVQSDNRVLNLTPFEVKYTENRPFFTEGTELFSKGNLFYSRRIGGQPIHLYDLQINGNEKVIKNPIESKLINATKISGRTQKGLGIGVLNAITKAQYAIIENTNTKEKREVQTDPLTNYNILVLDQTMKNNSSVTLVNTNVLRSGSDYDANVTAGLFSLNNKKNTLNVSGKVAHSRLINFLPDGKTLSGYSHSVSFGKTSGRMLFQFGEELADKNFNSNDLGYFTQSNYINHYLWMGYRWRKPSNWFNNFGVNFNAYYSRQLNPDDYRSANFNINANGQLKNLWFVGGLIGYEPEYNDYFEPRVPGRFFRGWSNIFYSAWVQTNNAKKYGFYGDIMYVKRSLFNSERYDINLTNSYRFNDKLSLSHRISFSPQNNNAGFTDIDTLGNIIFGKRDIKTIENSVNIKFSFNAMMNINTRIRHYWSNVRYAEFYTLQQDGSLLKNDVYNKNRNQNLNLFNIDMVYTWQFAPGSFINIVWKNAVTDFNQIVDHSYFKNFNNIMRADENNNISFKIIYFLDYLQLKKLKKKREG